MKKTLFLLPILFTGIQVMSQTFEQLINRLNFLPEVQRQSVADSFLNAGHTFPFVESDTLVHFVYNSPAQSVSMAGDATGWSSERIFTNITGSTFWYYSTHYEADARLDYKLILNGSTWILDPKNPYTCSGGYGPNSELRMPGYNVPPEISYYSAIPHGTIRDTNFYSTILGNNRKVSIYLPPGYPAGSDAYPLILFHDGLEYISLCHANNILDYLISNHQMAPVIGVFVPPVDRVAEYAGSKIDKFTGFITSELIPVIDARYKTSKDPAKRAIAGASDGGNISLYIGMKHPELFGKIAAQSSDVIPVIRETFSGDTKLDLKLYLDIGSYDIAMLIPMVHGLRDILKEKGYDYQFEEWHEGHSWGNWQGHLKLPLMQFFPWTSGFNDAPGHHLKLEQNRPNPFHGQTVIPFSAPIGSDIELTLVDLCGKTVAAIFSGPVAKSNNLIEYNHKAPPGQYIVTMKNGDVIMNSIIISAL